MAVNFNIQWCTN